MMISCEKAAKICNKTQYREATFIEKLKLRFHLFFCNRCAHFTDKNTKLSSICDNANLHALSEEQKSEMKRMLDLESN